MSVHTTIESARNTIIAQKLLAEIERKLTFLRVCLVLMDLNRYKLRVVEKAIISNVKNGSREAVERVFKWVKCRTICFSNCLSNAKLETADDWIRSLSFAWNQLI